MPRSEEKVGGPDVSAAVDDSSRPLSAAGSASGSAARRGTNFNSPKFGGPDLTAQLHQQRHAADPDRQRAAAIQSASSAHAALRADFDLHDQLAPSLATAFRVAKI